MIPLSHMSTSRAHISSEVSNWVSLHGRGSGADASGRRAGGSCTNAKVPTGSVRGAASPFGEQSQRGRRQQVCFHSGACEQAGTLSGELRQIPGHPTGRSELLCRSPALPWAKPALVCRRCTWTASITESIRINLVVFVMQNRNFGAYLLAFDRIRISAMQSRVHPA
jgi:hypothetical protein